MQQFLLFLLAIVAGATLAFQAGLNSALGKALRSPLYGTLVSFVTGGAALLLVGLIKGMPFGNLRYATTLPWYYWLGGVLGAVYVYAIIVLAPRLGVALTIGLTVAAQMAFGLLVDHFGWMGIPAQPVNWARIVGVGLIIGGAVLVRA